MPCRTDPDACDNQVQYRKNTARLYAWVIKQLKLDEGDHNSPTYTESIQKDSHSDWPVDYTLQLCELLKKYNSKKYLDLLFMQNLKISAKLRLWWIEHQEKDQKRIEKEDKISRKKRLVEQAKSKLTKEERDALGL